ncbi:MAG: PLP-dependent transferase [Rikenellaceae bacterium]|nr:PLP-dependent transferase [Rikenellaceae bacterium]
MKKRENLSPETVILHNPYPQPDTYNSLSMPMYNTVAFEFETAEQMESAFVGRSAEHAYSRITNPTVQNFENRVKVLTGGIDVVAFNSGMAAICNTIITVAYSGSNIVTSPHLFGNTFSFLNSTLKDFGVETRFCDLNSEEEVRKNIDENTCAVFLEIITNPQLEVVDLKKLSAVCVDKGVPLIADTTIVPFTVFTAKEFGINIEIVSSTKYISGGATSIGGLSIDYGTFDWSRSVKLLPVAKAFGNNSFTFKMRKEIHRNLGSYMTPQTAYMQSLGLETLQIRFEKAVSNTNKVVNGVKDLKGIVSVNYTGLPDNEFYDISRAQFGDTPGAMFTFDLESREACFKFLNNLKLVKRSTNLFDNKTLAIHPASTIYGTFDEPTQIKMNVRQTTIRISVGLENADDILADFKQALEAV